jgi:conjugal transfer mating pair stabilization protein TraG
MFTRYAEQYGGDSKAAQALMASELARQSLKPNRVFSDGTALPTSFEDVQVQHRQEKADTALNPAIDDRHQSNDRQVSRFGKSARAGQPAPAPAPEPSSTRQEVQARGTEIRARSKADQTGFDAKAEIVKTDDGTLASKKSLLKQSGRQVVKDAGATADNAMGVVKDLLKK